MNLPTEYWFMCLTNQIYNQPFQLLKFLNMICFSLSMFRSIFKHMLKERKRAAEKEKKGRRRSSGDSESASDSEIDGSSDRLPFTWNQREKRPQPNCCES